MLILGECDLVAKPNDDWVTWFFVVGDWGGLSVSPFDTPYEVGVADAMSKLGVTLNTSFQLELGDNFYYDSVQNVNDPRFQVKFCLFLLKEYLNVLFYIH
jgi:hypothetical protein